MCLVPLCLAVGIGALLYIMIKDEVMLKEMLIRFWNYAYVNVEWNFYEEEWLTRMFDFGEIRKFMRDLT